MKQNKNKVALPKNVYEYSVNYFVYHNKRKNTFHLMDKDKSKMFGVYSKSAIAAISLALLVYAVFGDNMVLAFGLGAICFVVLEVMKAKMIKSFRTIDSFVIPESADTISKGRQIVLAVLFLVSAILCIVLAYTEMEASSIDQVLVLILAAGSLFMSIKTALELRK